MATANESQGLKIAVAIFVTLTVVLAVSTYFAYTGYSTADAKMTKAEADLNAAKQASSLALNQFDALRKEIGARAEDPDAIKTEIKNEYKKIDAQVNALTADAAKVVAAAQAAGAQGPELEEAKAKVQQISSAYRGEPNKTYISALARLTDLLSNLSMLTTQLSLNYVDVKRNLEGANGVNDQKLKVALDELAKSKADLAAEHEKHEGDRQGILSRVDQFQSENAKLQAQIANLTAEIRKKDEDYGKSLALSQTQLRDLRAVNELNDNVLDKPDGHVTFVDYSRGEVHVDLTRGLGAQPQLRFTVFEAGSPGIPTATPKGSIELVSVSDRESIGRIIETKRSIDPIRVGDIIHSVAFSRDQPVRFALVGKIDINQDGRDDRDQLKRMIQSAGGIVDYDLPPPDTGKETGKLTGRDSWYVVDTRTPIRQVTSKSSTTATENSEFLRKQTEATREARLNGVRPMPIERLLPMLGYDFAAPVRGQAEAVDRNALKRLTAPRQDPNKPRAAPAEPREETPKEASK